MLGDREQAVEEGPAQHLVHGVVAPHVLAEHEQFAGRGEEGGGVQAAGLVEGGLLRGELLRELEENFRREAPIAGSADAYVRSRLPFACERLRTWATALQIQRRKLSVH